MSSPVLIPNTYGESIQTATISQWHKQDGDTIQEGDLLVTIDTDKVSNELEAESSGVLRIQAPEGEEVAVGASIALIEEGSTESSPAADSPSPTEDATPGPAPAPAAAPAAEIKTETAPEAVAEPADASGEFLIAPAVREYAVSQGVDLSRVSPSGAQGRILRSDVDAVLESPSSNGSQPSPTPNSPAKPAPAPKPIAAPISDSERTSRSKMSPLRRKIASHLVNAQQTAAILTTFNECDMTAVMQMRKSLQEAFVARHGIKLGFMSFFAKAVVDALQAVPQVNATIDGNEVVQNHFYDIGVAIGTEKGLVVPVVRDCDKKSFAEIEQEIADYAQKARSGQIELSDLQGGVTTISNGGIYGSVLSTPILNFPQSSIVGLHAIQERPVARNGEVVIRPIMNLALSYDHRLIDGKEAVTFLVRIKDCIEQPTRLMVGA